jgi:hypothetical protein
MSTNTDGKEVTEIEYSNEVKFYGSIKPLQTIDEEGRKYYSFNDCPKIITSANMRSFVETFPYRAFYTQVGLDDSPEIVLLGEYVCIDEETDLRPVN